MVKGIPGTENIYLKNNGYFYVSKHFSSGNHMVGTFKTLIEALMARDWAMVNNWEKYPKKTQTNEKYITMAGGSFIVTKVIGGKQRYYGGFKTLEKAIEHRNYCIKHGWSSNCRYENINRNIRKRNGNYEVYYTLNGKCTYFGKYNSLEHAREIRDLAEKYDGDWDLICEHDDGERAWLNNKKSTSVLFEKNNGSPKDYFIAKHEKLLFRGENEI